MSTVVAKFGGSSLADANQILKMKAIMEADKNRRFIVPSAPGKRFKEDEKVTDLLYRLYEEQDPETSETFDILVSRFSGICEELGVDTDIKAALHTIAKDLKAGASSDYAASRGEYLNGRIIADLLGFDFIDPKDFIFFDKNGMYDHKKTLEVLPAELEKHENAVIPGFYGSTPDGKIKTFSRGGSDITGSIVACCAKAFMYENWTDVPGFLKADPRIVDNPKKIDVITYRELRELSYMGATVLHEDAIFPVLQVAIPIHVRNTNDPESSGTLIVPAMTPELEKQAEKVTGIAGKKGFTVIAIAKNGMNSEIGFGRKVLYCLEKYNVTFEHMPSSIDTMCVVIGSSSIEDHLWDIVQDIHTACEPDSVEVFSDVALIATVGRHMIGQIGICAKLFTALANENVNVRMIDQGSSEMNIIVGVKNEDFEKAVSAIYNALV